MIKIFQNIKSLIITLTCFGVACFLIPFLIASYICVSFTTKIFLCCLSRKYPNYEFSKSKKIRSLIDTSRNAAIFHFLLEINGECDFEKIKEHYINNLIEKRNKTGEIRFPKLRRKLVSCWGHYAWVKDDSDFSINNHILLSAKTYRGRPVSESNLQEFVSDLVTKYLPPEVPPWQIVIIPVATPISTSPSMQNLVGVASTSLSTALENEQLEISDHNDRHMNSNDKEKYYILIRIHHLLLAEESNLHVGELLMLSTDKNVLQMNENLIESPKLANFIKKPKHIPDLWNHILITASNRWNEFIYHYDPLESPDVDKRQQIKCFSQLISILFITIVTIILDFIKGYQKTNNQLKYKFKYLINLYKREAYKRNLNIHSAINAIIASLHPLNIINNIMKFTWSLFVTVCLFWPYYIYFEVGALKELLFTGHTKLSNTLIGFLSIYMPLIYNAFQEFIEILMEIIQTPRNIYEELFINRSKEKNILQIKSYCGRKVISFSKSINMKKIHENFKNNQNSLFVTENEYLYACLGASLKKYFLEFRDHNIPKQLNVTCRTIEKDYFLERYDKSAHIGGVVFLQLPLQSPPNLQQINEIKSIIDRVCNKQIAIYLLSVGQVKFELITSIFPEVWTKIFINYFSINFPVTITEIYGTSSKMQVDWGHNVNDLLFFRPPQSKTCLSLNLHRFGNRTRLAVMADTQLAPEHIKISSNWENFVENTHF